MSAERTTLMYSMLEHLESLEPDHPMDSREALTNAMTSLSEAFNLDLEDPAQARNLSLKPHTLDTIFSAGAKSLGAKSAVQSLADLNSNPAFTQFVKVVSTKGYFKGVTEGTPEYDERMSKLVAKFKARTEAASGGPAVEEAGTASAPRGLSSPEASPKPTAGVAGSAPATGAKAEKERKAEEVKGKGNKLLLAKDYEGAEACYSEALELSPDGPNSHVYLCNRAAALCYLGRHDDAVVDCQESLELNPRYAKAHTRLGYAYFQLEDYESSVNSYRQSLEIEPGNAANTKSLKKALMKLGKDPSATDDMVGSTERGMPDLSALASMMGGGGDAGNGGGLASMLAAMAGGRAGGNAGGASGDSSGAGGAAGLAGMLNNPAMMAQAQSMMQNPAMMSKVQAMMSNPQMMSSIMGLMEGGGGGSGGSRGGPDLSALAGLMSGMGGAAGSGAPGDGTDDSTNR